MSHARYSPSKLPMLDKCPGFIGGAPGAPALRGTAIDEVVTAIVSGDLVEIPPDYEDQVEYAVSVAHEAMSLLGAPEVHPQRKLQTPIPGVWGTADLVLVAPFDARAVVLDYKSGWSDRGAAADHLQLLAYASGAAEEWDLDVVDVWLVEMDRRETRRAALGPAELAAIPKRIAEVIRRAKAATPADYCAGHYCSWCVRSVTCPAVNAALAPVAESAATTAENFAAALTPVDVGAFLSEWLARVELAYSIVASVKARAHAILEAGGEVPGWCLVNGRKTRSWQSEEEAEMALVSRLGDGAFTRKLRSPAQVEKLCKDDVELKSLVKSLSVAVPHPKLAPSEVTAP